MKEPKTLTWNKQQANDFHLCPDSVKGVRTQKKDVPMNQPNSNNIATFPPKNRNDNFCRILEGMKEKDVRKLASNATDELKTCDDTMEL